MSRSYKKIPYTGDNKGKNKKRVANSRVRSVLTNLEKIVKGSDYKKIYETWDICDYKDFCSWEAYWEYQQKKYKMYPKMFKKPLNKKEEYRKWYKWYKMK